MTFIFVPLDTVENAPIGTVKDLLSGRVKRRYERADAALARSGSRKRIERPIVILAGPRETPRKTPRR